MQVSYRVMQDPPHSLVVHAVNGHQWPQKFDLEWKGRVWLIHELCHNYIVSIRGALSTASFLFIMTVWWTGLVCWTWQNSWWTEWPVNWVHLVQFIKAIQQHQSPSMTTGHNKVCLPSCPSFAQEEFSIRTTLLMTTKAQLSEHTEWLAEPKSVC